MRINRLLGFAAALALIVAVASAAAVWAQTTGAGAGRRGRFHVGRALGHISRQLNLTDQQKEQIKGILRSHKADIKAAVDQRFAARKALRQAVASGDTSQISAAASQLSAAQVKAAQLRAQIRSAIFSSVLQPDQRAKAEQLAAQFEQKARERQQRIDRRIDLF